MQKAQYEKTVDIAALNVAAKDACEAIGISEATLYAYVSRGLVRARVDPKDGRRSLYDHRDIAALVVRQRRPRARRDVAASTLDWGEPSLPSSVSTIVDGKLSYRGQDVIELSRNASFEEISNLLFGAAPSDKGLDQSYPINCDGIDRILIAMAQLGTSSDDQRLPLTFELASLATTLGVRHGLVILDAQQYHSGGCLVGGTSVKGGIVFERVLIGYGPVGNISASSGLFILLDMAR